MLVMVAVAMSLVLTLAFLRTQATVAQVGRNLQGRDLALQAAHAGAAVALRSMQSPDWEGIDELVEGLFHADGEGTASYRAEFRPLGPERYEAVGENALHVVVWSTGMWESSEGDGVRVERQVEVIARLQPRVPGRPLSAADSAAASDVAANPGDYDQIRPLALFAESNSVSLAFNPTARIRGNIWLRHQLNVFQSPLWGTTVRGEVLKSIGSRFASSEGNRFPHPLARYDLQTAHVTFHNNPIPATRSDLNDLNVSWTRNNTRLFHPLIDYEGWRSYRLYTGGFEYQADEIGSTLRDVTLRPTPENPLGVFYRNGDVRLEDGVTLQGTLVSTGRVTLHGDFIHLSGYNWRGEAGEPLVVHGEHWPRLPALVANEVEIHRNAKTVIDGAVVVRTTLRAGGGNFQPADVPDVLMLGTATARPVRQPWSVVEVSGIATLSLLNDRGDYAVWLEHGPGGSWHPIVGVDVAGRKLTVVGDVRHDVPVPCRIGPNRRRYVELRGPLSGDAHEILCSPAWANLTAEQWIERRQSWQQSNALRELLGLPAVPFIDWLGDPANFVGWPYPYSAHGLTLEPVVHLRSAPEVWHRWSPPLFAPYAGSDPDDPFAGYRWAVVSWREVR